MTSFVGRPHKSISWRDEAVSFAKTLADREINSMEPTLPPALWFNSSHVQRASAWIWNVWSPFPSPPFGGLTE